MGINGGSMIFGLASWTLQALCIGIDQELMYWPPLWEKMPVRILLPPPENEHQWSVNYCWSCMLVNQTGIVRPQPIFNLPSVHMGKNASDNIASAS